jgi:putative transposase
MNEQAVRKTYKYKLNPTSEQERVLGRVLGLCRWLYNTALEQRIVAYRRCGVTLTCNQQQAELPDLKAALPEYAAIHSQVLQDVLTRIDKTYQAFLSSGLGNAFGEPWRRLRRGTEHLPHSCGGVSK